MSISTFQEKIFKSGCGTGILVFCALVFVGSLTYASCAGANNRNQQASGNVNRQEVVAIAGTPVYSDDLQSQIQKQEEQYQQSASRAPAPKDEVYIAAGILQQAVQQAAGFVLAKKVGADMSEAAVIKAFQDQWVGSMMRTRFQLMQQGLLKGNATDQEFEALVKKQTGKTSDQLKADELKRIQDGLKSSDTSGAILTQFAPTLAKEAIKLKMNPTDAQLKASYDSFTFKRIAIASTGKTAQEVQAQIVKAQTDLKSGTSFEQAMDRYSTDLPDPKKKVSDKVISMRATELDSNPDNAALRALKPGEVSVPIDVPEGKAIYKLISVKNEAPPDFDKNKRTYRDQYISSLVDAEFTKQEDAVAKDGSLLKWTSPAFKSVYAYGQVSNDASLRKDDTAFVSRLKQIAAEAKDALKDNMPGDDRWAALTYYAAIDDAWGVAKDKTALRDDRLNSLEAMLGFAESLDARMQLTDLAIQAKNSDLAYQQLLGASKANSDYTTIGQKNWADINAKLQDLQGSKLLSADQIKQIQAAQDKWRADKGENDKEQAAQAVAQAAQQKAMAEQNKKEKAMEEQTKKDIEKNKVHTPVGSAPGGAVPPTSGTGKPGGANPGPTRPPVTTGGAPKSGTATTGPAGPPPGGR